MSGLFANMFNSGIACFTLICVAFSIVLAMKRLRHHGVGHKVMVICANVVAGIAIIGLVIGFHYHKSGPITVVLITPNASEQSINRLKNEANDIQVNWVLLAERTRQKSIDMLESENVTVINSVAQLPLYFPTLSQVIVLGDGLASAQWQLLMSHYQASDMATTPSNRGATSVVQPPIFVQHRGYTPRFGLVDMHWQEHMVVGQQGTISGQLQSSVKGVETNNERLYTLTLLDPMNRELGSQILAGEDKFSFTITADIPGRWLYKLELTERTRPEMSISESINVHIGNGKPLNLLIKQSSPSFESRHLQNLIAEQGGKVLILTKISKNRDIRQQINIDLTNNDKLATPITAQGLDYFDILLIDQLALTSLSAAQKEALGQAIQNGLGVLVQVQSEQVEKWPNANISWLNNIKLSESFNKTENEKPSYLAWQNNSVDTPLTSVNAEISAISAVTLVADQNGRALVLEQEYGLGRVGVSLINTTHTWKTQGRPNVHSQYWQWLFSQLARTSELPQFQASEQQIPMIAGQSQHLCILNTPKIATLQLVQGALSFPLAITKQLIDDNTGCMQYIPPKVGWYSLVAQLESEDTESIALYANPPISWQAWQQAQRYQSTTSIIRAQEHQSAYAILRLMSVNPYWFWTLLMTSLLILWIERKYYRSS